MRRAGIAVVAYVMLIGSGFAESFFALPATTPSLKTVGEARPTRAWTRFCSQLPQECTVNPFEPGRISLNPHVWSTIVGVNERVNLTILTVTDQDHWGVVDRWDYPTDGIGDCEDIQLLKRKLLIEAGLPQRALRMTVVVDEHGEGHAVLMILTDRGDFILDNKRNTVLPWHETGYTYLMREGTSGKAWVALADQSAPVTTANR
jgi:predicted transglutaminase-like cysteine proteinase